MLGRCPQWDPSVFAKQFQLTEPEARVALTNAGYQAGQDGLWCPSNTVEGHQRRKGLEEIEQRAEANIDGERSHDGLLLDEEDESDDDQ